jgi:hypothetical protein
MLEWEESEEWGGGMRSVLCKENNIKGTMVRARLFAPHQLRLSPERDARGNNIKISFNFTVKFVFLPCSSFTQGP